MLSLSTWAQLAEPFTPDALTQQPLRHDLAENRVLVVPRVTLTSLYARLDAAVGPANWSVAFDARAGTMVCALALRLHAAEWVCKQGVAPLTAGAAKFAALAAANEAAAAWGIAREVLDTLPFWVDADQPAGPAPGGADARAPLIPAVPADPVHLAKTASEPADPKAADAPGQGLQDAGAPAVESHGSAPAAPLAAVSQLVLAAAPSASRASRKRETAASGATTSAGESEQTGTASTQAAQETEAPHLAPEPPAAAVEASASAPQGAAFEEAAPLFTIPPAVLADLDAATRAYVDQLIEYASAPGGLRLEIIRDTLTRGKAREKLRDRYPQVLKALLDLVDSRMKAQRQKAA